MGNENELIERLKNRFPIYPPVRVGIGDDGAVVDTAERQQVVVTDMLLEGVHFDLQSCSPMMVGRKAVAVNLSDIAAMGCHPTAAFVSLALSRMNTIPIMQFSEQLYDGIEELTKQFHFTLAGGDTNTWDGPFAINVCLLGVPRLSRPILRSGASPGDVLFVTGALGGSLESNRHLMFTPRLKESEWLVDNVDVRAMIDLSDGLSLDLHRLAAASQVAAFIDTEQIPVHADVSILKSPAERLASALNEGEDFELLFAVSAEEATQLQRISAQIPFRLTRIGEIAEGSGCWLRTEGGHAVELRKDGWEHGF